MTAMGVYEKLFTLAMQRAFANSPFGPPQSRRFKVVFVRDDDHSYWIAQILLPFDVKSDVVADSGEDLKFA